MDLQQLNSIRNAITLLIHWFLFVQNMEKLWLVLLRYLGMQWLITMSMAVTNVVS